MPRTLHDSAATRSSLTNTASRLPSSSTSSLNQDSDDGETAQPSSSRNPWNHQAVGRTTRVWESSIPSGDQPRSWSRMEMPSFGSVARNVYPWDQTSAEIFASLASQSAENTSTQEPSQSHIRSHLLFCSNCEPSSASSSSSKIGRHDSSFAAEHPSSPLPFTSGTVVHTRAIRRSVGASYSWVAKSRGLQTSVVPLEEEYFRHADVASCSDGPKVHVQRRCGCSREGIGCSNCGSPLGTRTTYCNEVYSYQRHTAASASPARDHVHSGLESRIASARTQSRLSEFYRYGNRTSSPSTHLTKLLSPSEAEALASSLPYDRPQSIDSMSYWRMECARSYPKNGPLTVYMFFPDAVVSIPSTQLPIHTKLTRSGPVVPEATSAPNFLRSSEREVVHVPWRASPIPSPDWMVPPLEARSPSPSSQAQPRSPPNQSTRIQFHESSISRQLAELDRDLEYPGDMDHVHDDIPALLSHDHVHDDIPALLSHDHGGDNEDEDDEDGMSDETRTVDSMPPLADVSDSEHSDLNSWSDSDSEDDDDDENPDIVSEFESDVADAFRAEERLGERMSRLHERERETRLIRSSRAAGIPGEEHVEGAGGEERGARVGLDVVSDLLQSDVAEPELEHQQMESETGMQTQLASESALDEGRAVEEEDNTESRAVDEIIRVLLQPTFFGSMGRSSHIEPWIRQHVSPSVFDSLAEDMAPLELFDGTEEDDLRARMLQWDAEIQDEDEEPHSEGSEEEDGSDAGDEEP